jgi:glycerol-3-phosphate dehydrogenase
LARDAAGRGLRVLLVEMNDLASGTSSASSKLIHGGLRYLEHGAFRLVREALSEREVLLRMAPHVIRPMRSCSAESGLRPAQAAVRAVRLTISAAGCRRHARSTWRAIRSARR